MSKKTHEDEDLIDSAELAAMIGLKSRAAINMRRIRQHPLPPAVRIPHMRRVLWRRGTAEAWIRAHEEHGEMYRTR